MSTEISEPGGRQQSVTRRVRRYVSIGMTCETGFSWPFQARQVQRPPSLEGMHIHP